MDEQLLQHYQSELRHLRESAAEFAEEYPKIAPRLGLGTPVPADPYVERLLEGFAYLTARIQVKFDAEFPRFIESVIESVYPQFLSPTPSLAIVQLHPQMDETSLVDGYVVSRDSEMLGPLQDGQQTRCEYRTAHDVTLWPVELVEAQYYTRDVAALDLPSGVSGRAGVRLRLRTANGVLFNQLSKMDRLPIYLRGEDAGDGIAGRLYEQLFGHATAMVVKPTERPAPWYHVVRNGMIQPRGFSEDDALLPSTACSYSGYRLLHEYFAFPERYHFFELSGLGEAMRQANSSELDVIILFDETDIELENSVDASRFALYCTPIINLFPRRADRIHLTERFVDFHVVPDRTRPLDYEVYQVKSVSGIGARADEEREFRSFYSNLDLDSDASSNAYYTTHRLPRTLSQNEKRRGARTSYIGEEVYLSIVDSSCAPYDTGLSQLAVETLCTNRDLPLMLSMNKGGIEFDTMAGAPIEKANCIVGPTKPRASHARGELAWLLVSHLSLNYFSLVDSPNGQGAEAMRELLQLYGRLFGEQSLRQVEGLKSIQSSSIIERVAGGGPIGFARGLKVEMTCDESAFVGASVFLFGAVMDHFLARYVSTNSFTQTVITSLYRGEVMAWPVRIGRQHVL